MELGWDILVLIDTVLNLGFPTECSIFKGTYHLRTSPDFILYENRPSRVVVAEPWLRWKSFRSTCALVLNALNVSWKKSHPLNPLCSTILYDVVWCCHIFWSHLFFMFFTFQATFKTRAPNLLEFWKQRKRIQIYQSHGESCGGIKATTLDLSGFAFRQDLFGKAIQQMSEWPWRSTI